MLPSQSFCSRTHRDWEGSSSWRCREYPVLLTCLMLEENNTILQKECCLDRPSSAPSQLDCRRGKYCCQLQEYLHSGWKMLWGSCTALNWSCSISSVLQEQSSYGRQPILLLIAITSQNFPICYFMWFWPPTILEVNFKATSRGSPSSFSLANSDKVSLRQFHLILVTMSMVYTSLLRWQLRWSSIKILHNVAKYTSVVKNYQTIYKYLSDIYFFELSIFLD